MEKLDIDAPADVFIGSFRKNGRRPMVHLRFDTGAEAIRYVIEAVEPGSLSGAVIETDAARLDAAEIRKIYERTDFPLARRKRKRLRSGPST